MEVGKGRIGRQERGGEGGGCRRPGGSAGGEGTGRGGRWGADARGARARRRRRLPHYRGPCLVAAQIVVALEDAPLHEQAQPPHLLPVRSVVLRGAIGPLCAPPTMGYNVGLEDSDSAAAAAAGARGPTWAPRGISSAVPL